MRKVIYILALFVVMFSARAQQLPQYTQYMLNEFAVNPAVAGKDDYADVRSDNRYQWVGITDAPRTYMLTAHGPFKNRNMGLGMHLFTDIVGPTRRVGLNFSYAYHIKLGKEVRLSLGLSAGILQWGIDGHKLVLHDSGDENLMIQYQTVYVPDFGAGLLLHHKKWYIGFAVPQLYQSKLSLYPGGDNKGTLVTQFNINGAYRFDLGDNFKLEPSFIVKYETPTPFKVDGGLRVIFKDQVWIGGAFRYNDAYTALLGFNIKNYFLIGYSYDFSTTNIRKYSSGTHEIMLGLRFSRKQNKNWSVPEQR